MKKKELTRPSQFLSNNLWELYTFISNLENSYIFSSDVPGKPGESLYYVEGMSLTELDTVYAHYSNGDLPEYKTEWLTLRLINAKSVSFGRKKKLLWNLLSPMRTIKVFVNFFPGFVVFSLIE